MVNTLIATTQQAKACRLAQLVGKLLVKTSPTRRKQKQRPLWLHCFDRGKNWLGPKQHARAATIKCIVDTTRLIAIVAQVVTTQINNRFFAGTPQQTFVAKVVDEFRKNRKHIDAKSRFRAHSSPSFKSNNPCGGSIVMRSLVRLTTKTIGTSAPDSSSSKACAGLSTTATQRP